MTHILIVDDQKFIRKALSAGLKNEQDLIIVGEAENGVEALKLMSQQEIQVAIIDLDMPEMNGFELTQKIGQDFPQTKVIIFSSRDDRDSINKAVKLGAKGYLLKDTSVDEIIDTIDYVQRGYFQLGPGLFEKLISQSINYELETVEHLSALKTKYQREFGQLRQEINNHNRWGRQEIFNELELKMENLKAELKQGLNKFQGQVYGQLQSGFDNLNHSSEDSQFMAEVYQQRYIKINKHINYIDNKYQLSLDRNAKEIRILRYGLIFLLIVFILEKIAIFMK